MCPNEEVLSTYYDDELPLGEKKLVKVHINNCPVCKKTINTYHNITKTITPDISKKIEEDARAYIINSNNRLFKSPFLFFKFITKKWYCLSLVEILLFSFFALSILIVGLIIL